MGHGVGFFFAGLPAEVVTSLVHGHHSVGILQGLHLMTPGIPEIGKAVDQHDQRPSAHGGIMDAHVLVLTVMMGGLLPGVSRGSANGKQNKNGKQGQVREGEPEWILMSERKDHGLGQR